MADITAQSMVPNGQPQGALAGYLWSQQNQLDQKNAQTQTQMEQANLQQQLMKNQDLQASLPANASGYQLTQATNQAKLPFVGQSVQQGLEGQAAETGYKKALTRDANDKADTSEEQTIRDKIYNIVHPDVLANGSKDKNTGLYSINDPKEMAAFGTKMDRERMQIEVNSLKKQYLQHDFSDIENRIQTGSAQAVYGMYDAYRQPKVQAALVANAGKTNVAITNQEGANARADAANATKLEIARMQTERAMKLLGAVNTTDKLFKSQVELESLKLPPEDRAAFIMARIAQLKAGTDKQEQANADKAKLLKGVAPGMNVPVPTVPGFSAQPKGQPETRDIPGVGKVTIQN